MQCGPDPIPADPTSSVQALGAVRERQHELSVWLSSQACTLQWLLHTIERAVGQRPAGDCMLAAPLQLRLLPNAG